MKWTCTGFEELAQNGARRELFLSCLAGARRTLCAFIAAVCLAITGCGRGGPPYSPKASLEHFRIQPGYRIELFASEPDVVSPVAMDIDEDGRIYVVEDRGYPLDTSKVGRVRLLQDTNGDGRPDRSTVFADNLVLPTGVMRWKKGILVTDAPDLLYFEDTGGDGRADVRKVVLTGFPFTNPQHTVNGPVYGLDNWIYLAHEGPAGAVIYRDKFGDRGSDIRFVERGDAPPLKERGRNIRFQPDSGRIEALSGVSQFGHAFDDWGHHFTLNNANHSRHEVIGARYLSRNRDLPIGNTQQNISDHGSAAKIFPISARPRVEMLTEPGEFTSACGLTFFGGSLFVAEPVHNLVHRDLLADAGSTFTARRAQDNVEFLASDDPWFRPVNLYVGPDGALYLLDYYRYAIEHPEWMATEMGESKDLSLGIDRGRIYRIVASDGGAPKRPRETSNLVNLLESANPWERRTAQRLLVDRRSADTVPALRKLYLSSGSGVGRLHALWTLEGLGKLDADLIGKALADPEAGVRENAIRLAELHGVQQPLLKMAGDPSAKVLFQLLCTLGNLATAEARAARDKLLFDHIEDRWFQVAALSASSEEAPRLLARAVPMAGKESPGWKTFFQQTSAAIAARGRESEIVAALRGVAASRAWWRPAVIDGLAGSRQLRQVLRSAPAARQIGLRLYEGPAPEVRRASLRLLEQIGLPSDSNAAVQRAGAIAADPKAAGAGRADAIALLAIAGPEPHAEMLRRLAGSREADEVRAAAVRALGRVKGDETARFLIQNWRNMTAPVRVEAAEAMYLEPSRVNLLLAALKSGDIQTWTLNFQQKRRLLMHRDPRIREIARPIFEQSGKDREMVLRRYEAALEQKADAGRGREVFERACAKCHLFQGKGAEVGPDLATVRNQPKQVLLTDILIPSRSIAQGYEAYVVELASGGTLDGVIGPQTPATITLRHEDGKEDVVPRHGIKQMYATNLSAMPADLDKQIDPGQMADLLEFLKAGR